MEISEANEYLAILVGSDGRVLLRRKLGDIGGYFIRTELSGESSPEASVIEAVFNESGLRVNISHVEPEVYSSDNGVCACIAVELSDPADGVMAEDSLVDWYSIDEAGHLISNLEKENEYLLEINALWMAQRAIRDSVFIKKDSLIGLTGSPGLESLKKLFICIERIFIRNEYSFQGLGIRLDLVAKFLDETMDEFIRKEIDAKYVSSLASRIGRKTRSKIHEKRLEELILILASEAYFCFKNDDLAGYKKAYRHASEYICLHSELYPDTARELRERGFKGGIGKRNKRNERESIVRNSIMDAVQRKFHSRARVQNVEIADQVVDEVLVDLQGKGICYARKEMHFLVLDLLAQESRRTKQCK